MSTKLVKVTVEAPEGTSDADVAAAVDRAHEAAVLALWEAERFSTREAAEELGLGYGEFLDLLASKGLPVSRGAFDDAAIQEARRRIAAGQPG